MSEPLALRPLTVEEAQTLREVATAAPPKPACATAPASAGWPSQGGRVAATKADRRIADGTVRLGITRCNADGRDGIRDCRRGGRPATYTPEPGGVLIAASLTKPDELGLPFASWTLDQLAAYPREELDTAMKRSRIGEILHAAGVRWRQQETGFGERPDPAFAEKRGPLSAATPPRLRVVS